MSSKQDNSTIVKADADKLSETNGQPSEIKLETEALVEAIKQRAQIEVQNASNLTREAYLNAVRQVKETIEANRMIDPEEIEKSFQSLQQEAEKNWQSITSDMTEFGDRLSEAAQAAWSVLTEGKESNGKDDN